MTHYADISLVITSCRRFGLLEQTIDSMLPWIGKFAKRYIVEDGEDSSGFFRQIEEKYGFTTIINGENIGQHKSIDRAYAEVDTKYIFHCEDDWLFVREPNFPGAMHFLDNGLEEHDKISLVCFRDFTTNRKYRQDAYREVIAYGSRYRYAFRPGSRYNSFTFNPSLLRRDLLNVTGPYGSFLTEGSIARFLRKREYIIVTEIPGVVSHLGEESHIPRRSPKWYERIGQWIRKGV